MKAIDAVNWDHDKELGYGFFHVVLFPNWFTQSNPDSLVPNAMERILIQAVSWLSCYGLCGTYTLTLVQPLICSCWRDFQYKCKHPLNGANQMNAVEIVSQGCALENVLFIICIKVIIEFSVSSYGPCGTYTLTLLQPFICSCWRDFQYKCKHPLEWCKSNERSRNSTLRLHVL